MSVARVTEVIASSPKGFDDAIQTGLARAGKTLQNIQGFWVQDMKGTVEGGKIKDYRVALRVTFILND